MKAISRTARLIMVLAGLAILASTIVARRAAGRGSEPDANYTEQGSPRNSATESRRSFPQ